MHFQAALFCTLVGTLLSAPVPQTLNGMNQTTIDAAHNMISKILQEIPATHDAWITSKSLTLGSNSDTLQYLKSMIPSSPILPNISEINSLESGLANISKGLQLHKQLLDELLKSSSLPKTELIVELVANIDELDSLIKKLQIQAGFDSSDDPSQNPERDLLKNLTSDFKTQAAAHFTLQQLQEFSCEVLQRITSISSANSDRVN